MNNDLEAPEKIVAAAMAPQKKMFMGPPSLKRIAEFKLPTEYGDGYCTKLQQVSANKVKVASSALASIPATITSSLNSIHLQLQSLLPGPTNQYLTALTSHIESFYLRLPRSARRYLSPVIKGRFFSSPGGFISALLLLLAIAIIPMSRWTEFWSGAGFSPFGSSRTPRVTDEDFSYIAPGNAGAPRRGFGTRNSPKSPTNDNLVVKHGKTNYPLHFPAFSIGDGDLKVGELRQEAARAIDIHDPGRVRLFYKGKNLKDDSRTCLEEGLRTGAELMCMASEMSEGPKDRLTAGEDDGTPEDDGTDTEGEDGGAQADGDQPKRKRNRNRKKKNKKSAPNASTSNQASAAPSPPPSVPKTALGKLDDISSHFHTKLLPLCVLFTSDPPADPTKREFEHRKLTETIFSEVMLKLDAVETEGDPVARQRRKDLVKETQGVLSGLDAVLKAAEAQGVQGTHN
ncbi:hypothetical protein FGG08_005467 [Glutinoglossum americanum]|uniref:BAG domain-containing protein n=1 Tax=Glutinoglossum americanum TaxID=1670608 RepID=A0A9P8I082_9PEZI|nr:hypothetical protein FGG08_005467 [Glutinoglossum americanum]